MKLTAEMGKNDDGSPDGTVTYTLRADVDTLHAFGVTGVQEARAFWSQLGRQLDWVDANSGPED